MSLVIDPNHIEKLVAPHLDGLEDELGQRYVLNEIDSVALFHDIQITLRNGQKIPLREALKTTIKPKFSQHPTNMELTKSQQIVIAQLQQPTIKLKQDLEKLAEMQLQLSPEEYEEKWLKIIQSQKVKFWLSHETLYQLAKTIQPRLINNINNQEETPICIKPGV